MNLYFIGTAYVSQNLKHNNQVIAKGYSYLQKASKKPTANVGLTSIVKLHEIESLTKFAQGKVKR